jgi:hypothetical protein
MHRAMRQAAPSPRHRGWPEEISSCSNITPNKGRRQPYWSRRRCSWTMHLRPPELERNEEHTRSSCGDLLRSPRQLSTSEARVSRVTLNDSQGWRRWERRGRVREIRAALVFKLHDNMWFLYIHWQIANVAPTFYLNFFLISSLFYWSNVCISSIF